MRCPAPPVTFRGLVVVTVVFALHVGGCGGSRNPTGSAPEPPEGSLELAGSVALPSGSGLRLTDLRVVTAAGEYSVGADGSFDAYQLPSTGPLLVLVTDAADRAVLYGYFEMTAADSLTLSAATTATAMLFGAVGGFSLPRDQWANALRLIAESPEAADLTAVVAARLTADPAAMLGDPQIHSALVAAAATLVPQAAPALPVDSRATAAADLRVLKVQVQQQDEAPPSVIVISNADDNPQSGVWAGINLDGEGLILTNNTRLHQVYWIYRTGAETPDGTYVPAEPWEKVVGLSYLPATQGTSGVVGSLADYLVGKGMWVPVSTDPILLPVNPVGAKRTLYAVVVAGSGARSASDMAGWFPPELRDVPRSLMDDWAWGQVGVSQLTFWKEMMIPLAFASLPTDLVSGGGSAYREMKFYQDLTQLFIEGGVGLGANIAAGDWGGGVYEVLRGMATNETLRERAVKLLTDFGILKARTTASSWLAKAWSDASFWLAVGDRLYFLVDMGRLSWDQMGAQAFKYWGINSSTAQIRITPEEPTVEPERDVALTVNVPRNLPGPYKFVWTTTGAHGRLRHMGQLGASFTSTYPTMPYRANLVSEGGDTDQVTVEVYRTEARTDGTEEVYLGTASVTVTVRGFRMLHAVTRTVEPASFDSPFKADTYVIFGGVCAVWKKVPGAWGYTLIARTNGYSHPNITNAVDGGVLRDSYKRGDADYISGEYFGGLNVLEIADDELCVLLYAAVTYGWRNKQEMEESFAYYEPTWRPVWDTYAHWDVDVIPRGDPPTAPAGRSVVGPGQTFGVQP